MSPKVADEHKEARRKQILAAAVRVFTRLGYQAATMKDVVEESGMSRGGVYLYYGSTERMMLDLIGETDEEVAGMPKLARPDRPVWETIEQLMRHLAGGVTKGAAGMAPVFYEFFITAWRKRTYETLMESRYDQNVSAVVRLLEEGARRGEFQPRVSLETIARMLFSFHDGMQIHAIQFGDRRTDTRGQTEGMLAALRHLLGVQDKEEQP
ncbi:TetR family transcriptional regulator [Cohnella caldifontis]|uniref:TetR family transcriptional regulator n=1 Tax=Cohnella caldifontis TaxID=3027471 RepID=UPI0023EBD9A5|nr:TetR family transcriptional regulator [Cohnella sp. YIM B05605]